MPLIVDMIFPRSDPTICLCDCHEPETDLSSNTKIRMVKHLIDCCRKCSTCGAFIMNGMMEAHQTSYCAGNWFDDRQV